MDILAHLGRSNNPSLNIDKKEFGIRNSGSFIHVMKTFLLIAHDEKERHERLL